MTFIAHTTNSYIRDLELSKRFTVAYDNGMELYLSPNNTELLVELVQERDIPI